MSHPRSARSATQHLLFIAMHLLAFLGVSFNTVLAADAVWSSVIFGVSDALIGSIAVDPKTPSIIYSGADKSRIMKSSDGGANWKTVYSPALYIDGAPILAVDPINTSTVYAALAGGSLLRSLDGGTEWQSVPSCSGSPITAVTFDRSTFQTMYLSNMNICKSIDGGTNWQRLDFGLPDGWVEDLVIDPNSSATLYAYTYNFGGVVKKSINGGVTWNFTGAFIPIPATPPCPDGGSCWYEVSPPMHIIQALAISSSKPAVLYAGTTEGLFASTDGGASWQKADSGISNKNVQCIAVDTTSPTTIYAGTPSGVFISLDSGQHWANMSAGLSKLNIRKLMFVATLPSTIYALSVDGAVFKGNPANVVPEITGTPPDSILAGSVYQFTPKSVNTNFFQIDNLPSWASFDSATGTLGGIPTIADAGTYPNIVVKAINDIGMVSLPPFSITVTLPMNLSVTVAGNGGGSVTSAPGGIACIINSSKGCSAPFTNSTIVTVYASPDINSSFGGWSGACQGNFSCVLTMSSDRFITATFTSVPKARIGTIGFNTLQSACTAAGNGSTILAREVVFAENIIFTLNNVTLKGGYSTEFSEHENKYTTVVGSLMIRDGCLTVDKLLIR